MKKVLLVAMLLTFVVAFPQNYKPGKVSKEELSENQNALNPDADAAVLYREHKTSFIYSQSKGFEQMTQVFERIKIYNPEGYNWGTKKIKAYNYNEDREQVESIKGTTFNLEDGKVKKTKLDKDNVFRERLNNYYVVNKLTMPNLKPGSVIEIEYTITSPFLDISDISLQYEIPINNLVVDLGIPDFYVYRNYPNPQASKSFTYDENSKNVDVTIRGKSGIGTNDYKFGTAGNGGQSVQSYKEIVYSLKEVNVPPLKTAAYVDNIENYAAKSVWELTMIKMGMVSLSAFQIHGRVLLLQSMKEAHL